MPVIPISIIVFARNITGSSFELWMQRRGEDGPLDGLLEFPGGKVEAGEDPAKAAIREVFEEVGVKINNNSFKLFKVYTHHYSDRSVSLFTHLSLYPEGLENDGWQKLSLQDPLIGISKKIPDANKQMILDICSYLKELKENETLEELWAVS